MRKDDDLRQIGRWTGGPWPYVGVTGLLLVTLVGMLIFRPGAWSERTDLRLRPGVPEIVALGERLYGEQCATCHGPAAETNWDLSDRALFRATKDGTPGMSGFGGILSDAEIIAALSYIKAQWPDDIRARQDRINAAAEGE